ncbi:uncharacterized protein TrAtP1_003447 [Trichoderma atroviride]|uniref:uncharacterized protein n=1 Tax=Hypocrea atroviridis TaxID=63577 RepID=UPI00332DFAFB|nr:hypothetical protein TrAtP1_003447 [Trichoderma atroviride]
MGKRQINSCNINNNTSASTSLQGAQVHGDPGQPILPSKSIHTVHRLQLPWTRSRPLASRSSRDPSSSQRAATVWRAFGLERGSSPPPKKQVGPAAGRIKVGSLSTTFWATLLRLLHLASTPQLAQEHTRLLAPADGETTHRPSPASLLATARTSSGQRELNGGILASASHLVQRPFLIHWAVPAIRPHAREPYAFTRPSSPLIPTSIPFPLS